MNYCKKEGLALMAFAISATLISLPFPHIVAWSLLFIVFIFGLYEVIQK